MWKFNKINPSDVITHREAPLLEFIVGNVLRGVPEVAGNYMYHCYIIEDLSDLRSEAYNYIEPDISFLRKATSKEIQMLINIYVANENYEEAQILKNLLS